MTKKKNDVGCDDVTKTEIIETKAVSKMVILNKESLAMFQECLKENLGGAELDLREFPAIHVPTGGSTIFTYETISGEESIKEINGIIVAKQSNMRILFNPEASVGAAPPLCIGMDGIGDGEPGGKCQICLWNKFGTAIRDGKKGRGKACKELYILFVLRPGEIMPIRLPLPTMSRKPATVYMMHLVRAMKPYWSVVTQITLEKAANAEGQPYAKAKFAFVRDLTPEEKSVIMEYKESFNDLLNKTKDKSKFVSNSDYPISNSNDDNNDDNM